MTADPASLDRLRRLLCSLHDRIRSALLEARRRRASDFAKVAAITAADTIYAIDRMCEEAIFSWFETAWPRGQPVELVMEGAEEGRLTFPRGTPAGKTVWKCILDPIDGTRSLMHDKRSAWVLSGLAPQRGRQTNLGDILVAAMTELPVTKQTCSDQISAVKGCGKKGIVAERIELRGRPSKGSFRIGPSRAADCRHGFASFARFFPGGKALTAKIEEELWSELYRAESSRSPLVFDDQYAATGGQLYELLVGHDRMLGDLRPLVFAKLGMRRAHVCHPYDICASLIFTEAGGVLETPSGGPLLPPLDTTTPVAWVGYANPRLARRIRPVIARLIRKHLS